MSHISLSRRRALLLLAAAMLAAMIVAMSLPQLILFPGEPFALGEMQPQELGSSALPDEGSVWMWLLRGALALMIIALPFYLVFSLMTAQGRRRLFVNVLMMIMILLLANYLRDLAEQVALEQEEVPVEMGGEVMDGPALDPPPAFTPDPPPWLTATVVLVASVLAAVVIVGVGWYIGNRRKPEPIEFDKLGQEADAALASLRAGQDFKSVIMRCYHEMSQVLREERGLTRDAAMTPREFEQRLIERGLPQDATRTLTRLFEQVRYGSLSAASGDEARAVACLTEIAAACRTVGQRSG